MVLLLGGLAGCGVSVEPLMPAPVIYTEGGLEPFAHLPDDERTPIVDVFYATNRERGDDWQEISYANRTQARVDLGAAAMRLGGPGMTWDRLAAESMSASRDEPIEIELSGIIRRGGFDIDDAAVELTIESEQFVEAINRQLATAADPEVFIYVHGAKVNFYNACAFTSQLAHFMGRDIVGVAFAWPTRQDILAYAIGEDVARAEESGEALAATIDFLAAHTEARKINLICWSAGARVVTHGLERLRARHADETIEQVRSRCRIGAVVFAAGDVPLSTFFDAAPTIDALADRVIVSISNNDEALIKASQIMGGGRRLGQYGRPLTDEQRGILDSLERFECIDVSYARQERGFNISGHRYWFNHPWASSDILLALRTELSPAERGLESVEGIDFLWYMPPDYPARLAALVERYRLEDWSSEVDD